MFNHVAYQGNIMIIDDDPEIREIIKTLLENENFKVIEADSPSKSLKLLKPNIDLIILDVAMPEISGFELCKIIRKNSNVPILFLTAKSDNSDLVMGYASGGDDYLTKPFSCSELTARVKGLLRRYTVYKGKKIPSAKDEFISIGELRISCTRNQFWKNSVEIELTDTEYKILKLLMAYSGQIFSLENIYEYIWEEQYFPESSNTVMVFIRKLRKKIEDDPKKPKIIITVWGKGYKIV